MTEQREEFRQAVGAEPERWLGDPHPAVRRTALLASAARTPPNRLAGLLRPALHDQAPIVRREAAEQAGHRGIADPAVRALLVSMLGTDTEPLCREAAAFALGEVPDSGGEAAAHLVQRLSAEREPLVREAIAAALGALGDPATMRAVIDLTTGEKPAVRRRAVVALAAFDDPTATDAIEKARHDRDRYVREAAEWLLGP